MDRRRKWNIAIFLMYALFMLWLLFFRNRVPGDVRDIGQRLNLTPLHTIRLFWNLLSHPRPALVRLAVVNLAGNILLFLPLGLLLPQAFQKAPRLWKTLLTAALLICAVEIAQLLTLRGSCDVDDLILNLLGTLLGYGVFRLTVRT